MVEILKDEIAKLETNQLYVFFFSFSFQSFTFLLMPFLFALPPRDKDYFLIMIIFCDYRRLLGKDLAGLGIKELQHLEQQINEGLSSVKERKVLILTLSYFSVFLPPPHQRCQISAMPRLIVGATEFNYRSRQFVKDGVQWRIPGFPKWSTICNQ